MKYIGKSVPKFIESMKTNYLAHLRSKLRAEYAESIHHNDICLQGLEKDFANIFDKRIISKSYRGLMLSYLPKVLSAADDVIARNDWLFDISWDGSHTAGVTNIRASKFIS